MAINFTPKKESEMSSGFKILPKGNYAFTVLESGVAVSKSLKNSGKQMVKLMLILHTTAGDRRIYDYFADWFSEWKLKHFLEASGFRDEYLSGRADPSHNAWADRVGFVLIGIEKDNQTGEDRNVVKDYLPQDAQRCPEAGGSAVTTDAVEPETTDEIPF